MSGGSDVLRLMLAFAVSGSDAVEASRLAIAEGGTRQDHGHVYGYDCCGERDTEGAEAIGTSLVNSRRRWNVSQLGSRYHTSDSYVFTDRIPSTIQCSRYAGKARRRRSLMPGASMARNKGFWSRQNITIGYLAEEGGGPILRTFVPSCAAF